jgi:uncharacterized protein
MNQNAMMKELGIFFVIACGFSWLVWLLAKSLLNARSIVELGPFLLLGSFGPTISALVVTGFYKGRDAVVTLFKKLFLWRISWKVYLLTFFSIPIIFLLTMLASGFRLNQVSDAGLLIVNLILAMPINAVLVALFETGPLGEELGWRGFALPRLLTQLNDFQASTILGVAWTLWHLPLFAFPDWRNGLSLVTFSLIYPATLIAFSYAMTKLWHLSKGSVLIAMLFHAALNFTTARLFDPTRFNLETYSPVVVALISLAMFVVLAVCFWLIAGSSFFKSEKVKLTL